MTVVALLGIVVPPAVAAEPPDRPTARERALQREAETLEDRLVEEQAALRLAEDRVAELAGEATRLAERADRAAARAQVLQTSALTRDRGVLEQLVDLLVPGDEERDRLRSAVEDRRRAEDAVGRVVTSLATARTRASDAEAAWSRTLDRLARVRGKVGAHAAARAAIARAETGETVGDGGGQVARHRGALVRWRRYLTQLADAGVVPPPSADLADLAALHPPLVALRDADGVAVPGLAAVQRGSARPLPVLPAETVRAVSTALGRVGGPAGSDVDAARCGGLVEHVWAETGAEVPPDAGSQWHALAPVSRRSAQVGDAVYLATPGRPLAEAGINLGDGLMVGVDPDSGIVRVAQVPGDQVRGYRRVPLAGPDRRPDGRRTGDDCAPVAVEDATAFQSLFLGVDTAAVPGFLPPGHGGTPPGQEGRSPGYGSPVPGGPLEDLPGFIPPPIPDEPEPPVPPAPQVPLTDGDFRVASFNVLGHSHTRRGGNKVGWADSSTRMRMTADLLTRYAVDLVGFQELQGRQARNFHARTGGRWSTYSAPGNTVNAVAWRKDRFRRVSARTVPFPYFGGRPQPMPVVRLRVVGSGKEFFLANFHLPASTRRNPGNERWRDVGTRRQLALVAKLRATGLPVLVTGDMNEREEYFCTITASGTMHAAAGGSNVGGRCRPPANPAVDWIVGSKDVAFGRYVKDRSGVVARASDHPLVVADVTLPD